MMLRRSDVALNIIKQSHQAVMWDVSSSRGEKANSQ